MSVIRCGCVGARFALPRRANNRLLCCAKCGTFPTMDALQIGQLVQSVGFPSAVAAVLIVYMTTTLSRKIDDLSTALRAEVEARQSFEQHVIKELTTQTIYLSQILLREGIPQRPLLIASADSTQLPPNGSPPAPSLGTPPTPAS